MLLQHSPNEHFMQERNLKKLLVNNFLQLKVIQTVNILPSLEQFENVL